MIATHPLAYLSPKTATSPKSTTPPKFTTSPKSVPAPPQTYLRTKAQVVRFVSEGPPSPYLFQFSKTTTGVRNELAPPSKHYQRAIIEVLESRLGDGYSFLPMEKGDRFEVLEDRLHAKNDHKFLVKQAFGEGKRGFINIFKVEMTTDQHRAAPGIGLPPPPYVAPARSTGSGSQDRASTSSAMRV